MNDKASAGGTIKVETLATIRNEQAHFTLAQAEDGRLLLTSYDWPLQMGTMMLVNRGDLLKWAREIIRRAGN